MSHKITKSLIAGAVALTSLNAIAQTEEITVWAWDPHFNVAIMQEAADRYKEINPNASVTILDYARTDIEQKLQTMLASGVTNSLPDIVLVEDYNVQKYLQSFPGSFAPMDHVVDYSEFAPYKVNVMTVGDKVYGMPFDSGVTGMYYRTDILAEAGFTAEDMENITWDRFIEIGKVVKAKTGVSMLSTNPDDLGIIRVMMQSGGEWYFNADGSLNLVNNEALKESLRVFKELMSPDVSRPGIGWSEWVGTVNSGQVATITTGVWITPSVEAGEDQSGKWAVAPTPRLNIDSGVHSSNLGGSSWYVTSTSDVKDTAIDFLNEIYAKDVDFYGHILTERGAVGSYMPAASSSSYQHQDEFFGGQKIYASFAQWLGDIPQVNYGMFTYEVDAALGSQIPAILQGAPIDKVLEQVEQQLSYQLR